MHVRIAISVYINCVNYDVVVLSKHIFTYFLNFSSISSLDYQ